MLSLGAWALTVYYHRPLKLPHPVSTFTAAFGFVGDYRIPLVEDHRNAPLGLYEVLHTHIHICSLQALRITIRRQPLTGSCSAPIYADIMCLGTYEHGGQHFSNISNALIPKTAASQSTPHAQAHRKPKHTASQSTPGMFYTRYERVYYSCCENDRPRGEASHCDRAARHK